MQLPFPQFLPPSNWKPPKLSDLPDLSKVEEIGFDLETYDPELKTKGCGAVKGKGFVVGYGLYVAGFPKIYLPIRHARGNLPMDQVRSYVRDVISGTNKKLITAKGSYDREWALQDGIEIKGTIYDIQFAECLINEERFSYSLDTLAFEYLGERKEEELMQEAAWFYGENAKTIMHLLGSEHVGPYAETDPEKTVRIFEKQRVKLLEDGTWNLFVMESELAEVFFLMRQKGVRLDEDKVALLARDYKKKEKEIYVDLQRRYFPGRNLDFNSSKDLAVISNNHGFHGYPTTDKGNPSFVGDWLDLQDWDFYKGVSNFRTIEKLRRDFLEGAFQNYAHKGRIHCSYNQLRGEDGGTRSGRVSAYDPNVQQVPSRGKQAKDIRSCFLPEDGEEWIKGDYSQQEYRIFVHFAMLMGMAGANEAGQIYIDNSEADFHQGIADMTGLSRTDAKNWNFAAIYGAGIAKTALMTKKSIEEATKVNLLYHEKVPYAKALAKDVQMRASQRGWIKTLGGRILHFETYEPYWSEGCERFTPLPYHLAEKKWPNQRLRRGQCRKGLNRLVQGSAADMMKIAMLNLWKKYKIVPSLQVHDDLSNSGDRKVALLMQQEMVNAIRLKVPIVADFAMGKSWGELEKVKL